MPTYEYHCDSCGYRYEKFQPITAKSDRTCPRCRRRAVQRIIQSGGGLIFKGSGFYATDYRSKGYQEATKKENDSAGKKEPSEKPAPLPKEKSQKTKKK